MSTIEVIWNSTGFIMYLGLCLFLTGKKAEKFIMNKFQNFLKKASEKHG